MGRPRRTNRHLPKYVYENHGSYWYKPPKSKAVRICPSDDAGAMYRFMADKHTPAPPANLMDDCFDLYEREVLPTKAPRTQKDYRKHLLVLRAEFGHMRPDDITPKHIAGFLNQTGKGKIQLNRHIALLSAVFSKAVGRWFTATTNPCAKVERNEAKRRDRYITDAEYAALYAILPPRVQVAMDLALLTGQRQGDLLALRWEQVSDAGILFRQGKTGKRLLVGSSPELQAVLDRAKNFLPHIPRDYVLRKRNGKPYGGDGFRAVWQRYMRRAVEGWTAGGKFHPPVLAERFTFHDLRAKSVSDSSSLQDAMERAGHTSMAMTRGTYDRGIRKVTPLR